MSVAAVGFASCTLVLPTTLHALVLVYICVGMEVLILRTLYICGFLLMRSAYADVYLCMYYTELNAQYSVHTYKFLHG